MVNSESPSTMIKSGTRIRYMGNKVALAHDVAALVADVDANRPLVDLFGGMCSIAGAVSESRRKVWVNDIQQYASLVARCLITSQDLPPTRAKILATLTPAYRDNLNALQKRYSNALRDERRVLDSGSLTAYKCAYDEWSHIGNSELLAREAARLRNTGQKGPHRLATLTFSWGYFGLRQSIEIDSIRAAIDAAAAGTTWSTDEAAWCRLALLQSCSRVASAPGHFAQFLRGTTQTSLERIMLVRARSVWDAYLDDIEHLAPFGTKAWRRSNRVFKQDALTIWPTFDQNALPPAIFYADPPYSKEQYSRFYHVLETLELYDYPEAHGIGRYRPDRFTTPLATKSGVLNSTRSLCTAIAERRGVLVLSYPSSGLLTAELGIDLPALLGEYFDEVQMALAVNSAHSTLGGRHGNARRKVMEYVWVAV